MQRTTIESLAVMGLVLGALGGMALAQPQAPAEPDASAVDSVAQEQLQGPTMYIAEHEAPFTQPSEVTKFVKLVDSAPVTRQSFEWEGETHTRELIEPDDLRKVLGAPNRTEHDGCSLWIYELENGFTAHVRVADAGKRLSKVWVVGPGAQGDLYYVYMNGC